MSHEPNTSKNLMFLNNINKYLPTNIRKGMSIQYSVELNSIIVQFNVIKMHPYICFNDAKIYFNALLDKCITDNTVDANEIYMTQKGQVVFKHIFPENLNALIKKLNEITACSQSTQNFKFNQMTLDFSKKIIKSYASIKDIVELENIIKSVEDISKNNNAIDVINNSTNYEILSSVNKKDYTKTHIKHISYDIRLNSYNNA